MLKTPLMQSQWPDVGLARREVLWLLDGIPAHRRPTTVKALLDARPVLAWMKRNQAVSSGRESAARALEQRLNAPECADARALIIAQTNASIGHAYAPHAPALDPESARQADALKRDFAARIKI